MNTWIFRSRQFSFGTGIFKLMPVNSMGLLPDTQNCRLRMSRERRDSFPRHRLQRKPLVSYPGMHHGTCVTHVPWSMSASLTRSGGENDPDNPGACATRNFTYLARGPYSLIPWVLASTGQNTHYMSWAHSCNTEGKGRVRISTKISPPKYCIFI